MLSVIEFIWAAKWVLASIWAVRIWRLGLVRRYPVLFTYLVLFTVFDLLGSWLYASGVRVGGQKAYNIFWVLFMPLCWLAWLAIVLELYGHMVERYAGVRKLGRMVMYGSLAGLAVGVSVLLYLDPYRIPDINYWKSLWLKQEQGVSMGIAALVLVLLAFKRVFSLSTTRNVRLVLSTFGLYFAVSACLMVLRTYLGPQFRSVRDMTAMMLYVGCLAVGAYLFSRAGEAEAEPSLALDPASRSEMAARAAQQLQSFNDRLVRALNA
jgi:hypothetical protein